MLNGLISVENMISSSLMHVSFPSQNCTLIRKFYAKTDKTETHNHKRSITANISGLFLEKPLKYCLLNTAYHIKMHRMRF